MVSSANSPSTRSATLSRTSVAATSRTKSARSGTPQSTGRTFPRAGNVRPVDCGVPDRAVLVRLVAATEVLLSVAERVDGEFADETILADLHELRDRAYTALLQLTER